MRDIKVYIPKNSGFVQVLLVLASCIFATTTGYDSAVMTGFNIIPAYANYFKLDTVTRSVLTAVSFVGAIVSALSFGPICNKIGRKNTIIVSAFIKFLGIGLMAGAQSYGMFLAARVVLGFGSGISGIGTPTWLAETLPYKRRGSGLSLIFAVYFVGSLTAAGVTYGCSALSGNIGWRLPSALQGMFSGASLLIVLFCPESPRWLIYMGRTEEALQVVAYTHSNGDIAALETVAQHQEIIDNITWERENGETLSYAQVFRTASARKRILLVFSMVIFSTLTGNSIITYFLGSVLDQAGVTNSHTQLEINIVLQAWNLVCALVGSQLVDRIGRRTMALASVGCCTVFLFLLGGLTKLYGGSANTSGNYAVVAVIFLFQGSYAFGVTNLTLLYPPEVLSYSIRATGMAIFTAGNFSFTIFTVFAMPLALKHIGYKMYLINACWDVLQVAFIYFLWVETSGKTLEEIEAYFDGENHGDTENLGKEMLGGKNATSSVEPVDAR
ncbi:hypothetical protein BP6252_11324 [Coleophoma cylindrospora]|uniref:Major facilitator superfamily (MFS) profile domain-containing protein n=1 Tax=Coleophoma cylindrospora TaxID=1849047 RepID=A0A3D8QPP6_9HELO|nr:hypothetical protein BP6252_11324 [Coleophoma cylindrospora]